VVAVDAVIAFAFTEQGVAMLSSALRSPRAVQVNIAIMHAFLQLREMRMSNADLARKLLALENKYDAQFRVVFEAHSRTDGRSSTTIQAAHRIQTLSAVEWVVFRPPQSLNHQSAKIAK
jgi:hypothetical protein